MKKQTMISFLALLLWSVLPAHSDGPAKAERPARTAYVNAVGCSLFDMKGKLLKRYAGWVCAFFPNGKMLLGDGFTLTFYDEKMNVVWSKDVHTHHMITYFPKAKLATVIASNIRKDTRSDRLEVYDIEGRLKHHFDVVPEPGTAQFPQGWDNFVFPEVKWLTTMIESFNWIGPNRSKLPFLKEGNYVAFDASGYLYFFDKNLKPIRKVNVRDWNLKGLRDVQVSKAGDILAYNSGNTDKDGKPFTSLDEIDPVNGEIMWTFRTDPPAAFYGAYEGNVQELENGNMLFSVVMNELEGKARKAIPKEFYEPWMEVQGKHRSFEVTRAGKTVWSFANDGSGLSGMPNVVKRMDLYEYLGHKGRY